MQLCDSEKMIWLKEMGDDVIPDRWAYWSNCPYLFPLPGNQGGMNSSYYGGGSRGSMGMNGLNSGMSMGAGWGM